MSHIYDRDDILEGIAIQNGCSNGSCGYDFDDQCYWWLLTKVDAEIARREVEDASGGPKTARPEERNSTADYLAEQLLNRKIHIEYDEGNSVRSVFDSLTVLGDVLDKRVVLEVQDFRSRINQCSPIILFERNNFKMYNNVFDDVFADMEVLCNQDCYFHGGILDQQMQHIHGNLSTRVKWGYPDDDGQTLMDEYSLVLMDRQPHYFYEPKEI